MKDTLRIGSGAGYAGDRLEPALELLRGGDLDYIGFECLAERTIALAQLERNKDANLGYNPMLEYRLDQVLPLAWTKKTRVITNMGAANPAAALTIAADLAKKHGLKGMKLAAVTGDDVLEAVVQRPDLVLLESGDPLEEIRHRVVSANAYLGAGPLVEALSKGAHAIITGRVADPALFLAPMIHEFGWSLHDYSRLGKGTLIGHLLECAGQVCGGYFAEPGRKEVPDLWNLGFPLVEVAGTGDGVITKVAGTGGLVSTATVTEQLLYEIHDPACYLTPDCTADFSSVTLRQEGPDRVRFSGAGGHAPTDTYKVSVGYRNGYLGEGEISYGGPGCVARARLAAATVLKWLGRYAHEIADINVSLIGLDSLGPEPLLPVPDPPEVRLRVCGRCDSEAVARRIGNEVEALYTNGPAGGGGASRRVSELISVQSVLLPKSMVRPLIMYTEI